MDKTFSILLDLTRLTAALLVFFHHAQQILKDSWLSPVASFGHDAVIFFFILSGFVIGYVSAHKEKSITDYAVARLARIYSVALPSLLLVFFLYFLGNKFFPLAYPDPINLSWLKVFISSIFFLNSSTSQFIAVPTNGPYWSICYEVWYYIIFGIAFYITGYRKYILLVISTALAGLKILILMPIWLLGFFCFLYHYKLTASRPIGWLLIICSILCYFWIRYSNFDDTLFHISAKLLGGEANINEMLRFGKRFAPDYVIAILFVLFFSGIFIIRDSFERGILLCSGVIKLLSSFTFSLYLYHFPILYFLSTLIGSSFLKISICLILIGLIGCFSERKKHKWQSILRLLFSPIRRNAI